ncbi:MAG: Vms1/Ankzf1 family peptidyl-tRNA hydrolase [Anaerolineae bacterium]|nr:Vms1/Ankzf1 family peptidyl-tRNA hydrolase [Anaerolineae bacterium]
MITEQDLRELAEVVNEKPNILSLYLHLDRRSRSFEEHKLALRSLLAQAAEQGAAPADIERIERFFEHEFDRQGRMLACFSCQSLKFWRGYSLLVPGPNTVYVGRRPYLKPLSDIWDNYGRFGVLMVDREGARAFIYHLGALINTEGVLGAEVRRHKQGGWAAQKLQRYEDQEARHNLKAAAEWAEEHLTRHRVDRVVLAGTEENLAEFRAQAPRALNDKVVGQINLDMNTSPAEAWERAFEVAQQAQQEAEADLLEQVITLAHKGGAGVTGLADTLAAMQQGRLYHLLVSPKLHAPGYQCANCEAVLTDPVDKCPYCEGALNQSADVVNLVVHRAIDSGIRVSVLERDERLNEVGGIAAVLRY